MKSEAIKFYFIIQFRKRNIFFAKVAALGSLLLLFVLTGLRAQTSDSLQLFREFIDVSNAYKQLPLQMKVDFKQQSNFPLAAKDTITLHAKCDIKEGGAYISFGDMEQIINDTLALVVMNDIKQMALTENDMPVAAFLKTMIVQPLSDTSVQKAAAVYTIQKNKSTGEKAEIALASRNKLMETELPVTAMQLEYSTDTHLPERVTMIKRSLIKIPSDEAADSTYKASFNNLIGKRITLPGKGDFIVKEEQTVLVYQKIEHLQNVPLPVTISNRLVKNKSNVFEPVIAYQNYHLSKQ